MTRALAIAVLVPLFIVLVALFVELGQAVTRLVQP
jgi:Flp pilus assembly protein TadG